MRWSAALCALAGLGALVAHVLGMLPMPYFLTFLGVPSLLLLFMMAAFGRWVDAEVFVNALAVGLVGGIAGTLVYDGVRFVLHHAHVFNYDGFAAIYLFGGWITSTAPTSARAAIAGWTYHFWNGISFGIFYALAFNGRPWLIGVAYGVVMELCMLGLFPLFLRVTDRFDFIALSLVGHLFYGAALGLLVERWGRRWDGRVLGA